MNDENITLHICVVCGKSGTNYSMVMVGEVAVCQDCVQKEQIRKEKEDE